MERDSRAGQLELRGVSKSFPTGRGEARAVRDIALTIQPGQFVTLLGPSGCGKTTTLRMIAGFESPTGGDILLDGVSIVRTPPNKRPMSMVFQSYALFPHLTVADNIGFGLRVKRIPKHEIIRRVRSSMEVVGIEDLGSRHPHELSGGQQQRVALARAIVMESKILLFDEPLSNLDAKLRLRMRDEIRAIQRRLQITSIFVTHDQSEALTMSDRIVVMNGGHIEQAGSPEEVYRRPTSRFVAAFLGSTNFIPVSVLAVGPDERATIRLGAEELACPCAADVVGGAPATLVIRSEGLRVLPADTTSSGVPGRVITSAFDGPVLRYTVETAQGILHAEVRGDDPAVVVGENVRCVLKAESAWVIAGSGDRL